MKKNKKRNHKTKVAFLAGASALMALVPQTRADNSTDSVDRLLNKLEQKGVLTADEANELKAENSTDQTNSVNQGPPSVWKISNTFKSINLFGDLRFRYEYRGADNVPGASPNTYYRERFRYALRFGIKGDLVDNFYYGLRLETSTNPRSPWDTFGNNTTAGSVTPSDKAQSGIGIGQAFIGWKPASWFDVTVGRMPMPLYITPMVWDSDINPEGAFEKLKYTIDDVDLFVDMGQFDYQNPSSSSAFPSSDTFLLAWQAGGVVRLNESTSFKIAPVVYTYAGKGASGGLNDPFVGQGKAGVNVGIPGSTNLVSGVNDYNEQGLDHLLVLEVPAEFDFEIPTTPLGSMHGRLFGDFAYNFEGDQRADAAYNANPAAFPGLTGPVDGQNIAYQVGIGFGTEGAVYGPTQGLVYGTTSKKNTWEARFYWQHVEQYALDVNLIDSDFFEGRGNLQGFYAAFAYSLTDAIIGTIRIGYADRINDNLGTGGNNLDIPGLNPIRYYKILQADLTWRF
ncbi:MAG TPA: putative porin [Verrucomicrobiae bacterium]|nr:putative porin [Verrucomicrobiae bacterium]